MTKLPEVCSWSIEPEARWFSRCRCCRRLRVRTYYFEVYGKHCGIHGSCWWYECLWCFVRTLTGVLEVEAGSPEDPFLDKDC